MSLIKCPECKADISDKAVQCPRCGYPLSDAERMPRRRAPSGREWKSKAAIGGMPLVHVAYGRDEHGKLRVARGIIAIGQFGVGLITIAQFGVGYLFAFGQCVAGAVAIGQVAIGVSFGLGQIATGMTAIGMLAFGRHVWAMWGLGQHVWTMQAADPEAVARFRPLLDFIERFAGK